MSDETYAFPRPISTDECTDQCNVSGDQDGMTLRDWFAGQAIKGMAGYRFTHAEVESISDGAYTIADAMMEARKAKR